MQDISFPPAKKAKRKRVGLFLRVRPEFVRMIRASAARKGMTQVHFVETCIALHGTDAQPGLKFKFQIVKE